MKVQSGSDDDTSTTVLGVLVVVAIMIFLIWLFWLNHVTGVVRDQLVARAASAAASASASAPTPGDVLAQMGQAGDAFGSLNTLFAGLGASLLAAAAYLQNEQLRQARAAYEEERRARQRQEFEGTFFQMLELVRDLVGRVEEIKVTTKAEAARNQEYIRRTGGPAFGSSAAPPTGAAALDAIASRLVINMNELSWDSEEKAAKLLATVYERSVYKLQAAALGPCFRLLFQVFRMIDESNLEDATKIRYANIVRGQLSEGAAFLLGLNGLTSKGYRFIPFIEKYGLLEHADIQWSSRFRGALRQGYRERAFHGSRDRERMPHNPMPLQEETFFVGDEAVIDAVVAHIG